MAGPPEALCGFLEFSLIENQEEKLILDFQTNINKGSTTFLIPISVLGPVLRQVLHHRHTVIESDVQRTATDSHPTWTAYNSG